MPYAAIYVRHNKGGQGEFVQRTALGRRATHYGYSLSDFDYVDASDSTLRLDMLIAHVKEWGALTEFDMLFITSATRLMHPAWKRDRNVARVKGIIKVFTQAGIGISPIYFMPLATTADMRKNERKRTEERIIDAEQMEIMTKGMRRND